MRDRSVSMSSKWCQDETRKVSNSRLGPNGEISSYVLHPERKHYDPELPKTVYICEVCKKDCHNYTNLGSHRKHIHKLPYR